jgi:hypothetical protein
MTSVEPQPDLGDRHPQQPGTCGGCPPGSCRPSVTGSSGCSTRPRGIGPWSWSGRRPAGSRPTRPWSSSPPPATAPSGSVRGCFACAGRSRRPASERTRWWWWWLANRPTGPPRRNWRCASISSAGPGGWRPTPTSALPTATSCGSWPGSAAPRPGRRIRAARLPPSGARADTRDHGALDRSQRDHAHAAQQRAEAPGGPAWCWPPARPPGCWPPNLCLG